jgi:hypothetical protein
LDENNPNAEIPDFSANFLSLFFSIWSLNLKFAIK